MVTAERVLAEGLAKQPGAGLLAVAAAAAAVLALWPSLTTLHEVWQRIHDYQHGYLIAAIAAVWYGIVARRVWRARASPHLIGSLLLGVVLLLWLIAFTANSLMIHQLLLPVVVWAAVFAVAGWGVARAFVAPVIFLYFATPIWDYGVPVLQRLSVFATEALLGILGVPAEVQEHTVTIPEGTFTIIEGCSGKRYFVVTLAVAMLAATVHHMSPRRFVAFLGASAALALVANWIRILIIIYAGHVTDMHHYLVREEHLTFGNVVFGVLLLGVLALARYWSGRPQRAVPGGSPVSAGISGVSAHVSGAAVAFRRWGGALPFVLLFGNFAWLEARASVVPLSTAIGGLPVATGKWQGPLPPLSAWAPHYVQPDGERRAAYRSPAGSIELYANVYGEQQQNRELIHYSNTLLAPGTWKRAWPQETRLVETAASALAAFEATSADGNLWLIAYTFEVGGWGITSEPLVQLAYGVQSLLRSAPAGVVVLATPCDKNCEAARSLVASFWDDMSGRVLDMVPDEGQKQ